ncbi:RNA recognition motif domain-containing protein [Pseudomonas koreensis]|jgi:hypothetical protein|uniref:RNA recognition motif domain-containing protein n=1 Tax=Pseudomonas koreensis TaxID=198620 RepID=UPI001B32D38A|nr:RNA-binding protein [Pseudomonas koreensis]MBP4002432.1 RNA-binding protein [Pseudomonas koreensis]
MANVLKFQVVDLPSDVTEEQLRKAFLKKYSGEIVSVKIDRLSQQAAVQLVSQLSIAQSSFLPNVRFSELLG